MNGTPTVSWQRLCAIDRVKLKVIKDSSEGISDPEFRSSILCGVIKIS